MEIALVTGPSSGIGLATAVQMAERGYHVVAAGRSVERTMRVVDTVRDGGGSAEYLQLDLASLESCRIAAETFESSSRTLDVLINNAGVGGVRGLTDDGFEIHFGVNHLGHFLLTRLLEPTFRPGTRIVVVSSEAHRRAGGIDFDSMQRRSGPLRAWSHYSVSKLANILFARRLAQLQPEWRTYSVHPGLADTNIFPAVVKPLFRNRMPADRAAATGVHCATSADVNDESGLYYSKETVRRPSSVALNDELARRLWERSEQWCGTAPGK